MASPNRPGLGRRFVGHDERSRAFGIASALPTPVERKPTFWSFPRWTAAPLDQQAEGACFPAGTLVRLADGSQRKIEEIRLLDEVVTAEGRTGRVLQTMVRSYDEPLVRVVAWGHSHLRCTPNHPILTRRGYVPAGELTGDDWIALPRYFPVAPVAMIAPQDIVFIGELRTKKEGNLTFHSRYGTVDNAISALPDKIEMDEKFGRLIGLYAAEGCQTANKVVWCYGSHEQETLVPETVELIRETLGAEARIQVRPNNSTQVVLYGKHWRHLFATLVPGTTKHGDKHLSRHVTNTSAVFLRAVLDGWHDGDGHVRRKLTQETRDGITVSKQLGADMHAIAVALGCKPAIVHSQPVTNRYAATRQSRWNIKFPVWPDGEAPEETRPNHCLCGCGGLVPVPRRYRVSRYITGHHDYRSAAQWRTEQDDQHLWRKVREVVEEPFDGGYVFNLHVEGDESYVADGVGVHNCTAFSLGHELAAGPIQVCGIGNRWASGMFRKIQATDRAMGNDWPDGASMLASAKTAKAQGLISGYRWAFGAEQCVDALVGAGPVWLGITWYEASYEPAPDGLLSIGGQIAGGHAICAVGYDEHPRHGPVVALANSWGRSWGVADKRLNLRGGVGYLRVADLDTLLRQDGEAIIAADFVRT